MTVKHSVQELLDLNGALPPTTGDFTQEPQKLEDAKHLYASMYAPGWDSFMESKWYSVKGLTRLLADPKLLEIWSALLDQFRKTDNSNADEMRIAANVEARAIWSLGDMVTSAAAELTTTDDDAALPALDDAQEAARRMRVFENLITGQVAKVNMLTNPAGCTADPVRAREFEFWYHLANFVCLREDDTAAVGEIEDTMSKMRNVLDGRENRDVLYSIAVIRALTGQRVTEFQEEQTPLQIDESDPRSKLHVAKRFISNEAGGQGTTNVIRRLCEIYTRQMHSLSALNVYAVATASAAAAPPPPK